jgi:hypothetical protein
MAGFRFPLGAADFSLLHSMQTDSDANPTSYPMDTVGFFPGENRPERETDQSPLSSFSVKNYGVIHPLSYAFRDV